MSDSVNTVLIGGPKDGEVLAVERRGDVIRVMKPLLSANYPAEPDVLAPVETLTETYYPETLSFFGVGLQVHLHESLAHGKASRTDLANALGKHLLSANGKKVALP